MTRPEHVRCENCCYWKPPQPPEHLFGSSEGDDWAHENGGFCCVQPKFHKRWEDDFCREFRAEWPSERKPTLHLPELATCCECGLRFVKETMYPGSEGKLYCRGCSSKGSFGITSGCICGKKTCASCVERGVTSSS